MNRRILLALSFAALGALWVYNWLLMMDISSGLYEILFLGPEKRSAQGGLVPALRFSVPVWLAISVLAGLVIVWKWRRAAVITALVGLASAAHVSWGYHEGLAMANSVNEAAARVRDAANFVLLGVAFLFLLTETVLHDRAVKARTIQG